MRELADSTRIEQFMHELGRADQRKTSSSTGCNDLGGISFREVDCVLIFVAGRCVALLEPLRGDWMAACVACLNSRPRR